MPGNGNVPEVVVASDLAAILKRWAKLWTAERNADIERNLAFQGRTHVEGGGSNVYGPWQWLEEETARPPSPEFPEGLPGIHSRRLYAIRTAEIKHVSLEIADRLINAIGWEHVFHTGELRVVPNPRWNPETWEEWRRNGMGQC